MKRHTLLLSALTLFGAGSALAQQTSDTCLMFTAHNIAKGQANFYLYCTFSRQPLDFKSGDVLEYDIYLDEKAPQARGGLDVHFDRNSPRGFLRETDAKDQNGLRAHGDADLKCALGTWYTRKIAVDGLAGHQAMEWTLNFEGDTPGDYTQFIDNVRVRHADGSVSPVYTDGPAPAQQIEVREGYSKYVTLMPVARQEVTAGPELQALIAKTVKAQQQRLALDALRQEVEATRKLAEQSGTDAGQSVAQAAKIVEEAEGDQALSAEKLQASIHAVRGALDHLHPVMRRYTSHLVGHAHIDFQWLWEWPETLTVCRDTFNQAAKFMEEYPDFCFSQSSTALYQATEENYPEIFRKMIKYINEGRWELTGGRVTEADTHMLSPESHARQFLYGQSYFREHFNGKQAVVGWECDTFGHTWTMPQILKLAGLRYYYFMRDGDGKTPLFWWEAPDGSRVLAFQEDNYNGEVNSGLLDELASFEKQTGARDHLHIYGVGNHGGGPTREHLASARELQKKEYLPAVKFSTAHQFFESLEKIDLTKIPVVKNELNSGHNGGFLGCLTSEASVKRWNRDAESLATSADAIAALAAQTGFTYPQKELRQIWQDILWNQHHDTICGSAIHASYNKSEQVYKRAMDASREVGQKALEYLAKKVGGSKAGVLVFNPLGWSQSEVVEVTLPAQEGATSAALCTPEGKPALLQPVEGKPGKALLYAENVPSYGYRRYSLRQTTAPKSGLAISEDGTEMENDEFSLRIDSNRGVVTRIYDKLQKREMVTSGGSANRLEVHWEAPNGMSAWVIGKIQRVEKLEGPVDIDVVERGPVRVSVRFTRRFQSTDLVQTVSLPVHGAPQFALDTQWKELGSDKTECPFLKVAFDVAVPKAQATYDIPYGSIARPADNTDHPALTWLDCSSTESQSGAALLNDCKHAYSVEGNTMRLSLIRSSYYPDPRPNDRPQSARWSLIPHAGDWREAGVIQAAQAFNRPMWSLPVEASEANEAASLPAEKSLLSLDAPHAIVTAVKQAEKGSDLVVRLYEPFGRKARTRIESAFPIKKVQNTNFMEDKLSEESSTSLNLRPSEIRSLKLEMGKETGK